MGYQANIRAFVSAQRREERGAQKRLRELERQAKEQTKFSSIELARLEVETFEGQLEVLISVHKEQSDARDWKLLATALPPPIPKRNARNEQKVKQLVAVLPTKDRESSYDLLDEARLQDAQEFGDAERRYFDQIAEWKITKSLAERILAGEHAAYTDALVDLNPFAEMSDLGSAIHFTVHTAKLAECVLKVNGKKAVPAEVKTLTSGGKISVKPMPKGRFQELYKDYLCSCVLRVAREIFALLPVDELLVSATADAVNPDKGQPVEHPVLSVFMQRAVVVQLDFDNLDASDAIESLRHRGDFKSSRKSEAFLPIVPLGPADVTPTPVEEMGFHGLWEKIQAMREELKSDFAQLSQQTGEQISQIK